MEDNKNGSKKDAKDVLDFVEGITPLDPAELAEFEQAMTDDVIPEIVKVVEERRLRAAQNRHRQLKY
ncbi:MAG: hypothetical protein WAU89_25825 [Candidatus Acidiferrales bacterium]